MMTGHHLSRQLFCNCDVMRDRVKYKRWRVCVDFEKTKIDFAKIYRRRIISERPETLTTNRSWRGDLYLISIHVLIGIKFQEVSWGRKTWDLCYGNVESDSLLVYWFCSVTSSLLLHHDMMLLKAASFNITIIMIICMNQDRFAS